MTYPIILCAGIILGALTHDSWQHRHEDQCSAFTVCVTVAGVLGAVLTVWEVFR